MSSEDFGISPFDFPRQFHSLSDSNLEPTTTESLQAGTNLMQLQKGV